MTNRKWHQIIRTWFILCKKKIRYRLTENHEFKEMGNQVKLAVDNMRNVITLVSDGGLKN